MDKKKLYELWIEKKHQVEINKSFPDKVMGRVYEYERRPRWFDIPRLIEIISVHTIIKNGLVVIGALVGFIRVIYVITMVLSKGVLNG
jgi:hypothetical protein